MKILATLAVALTASAQTTKSYDVTRSNLNAHETSLTAASLAQMDTAPQLIPCRGDARGCEAQPVVDEAVPIAGATRAVMALSSEANIVRGVDPDSTPAGTAIWETPQLCVPIRTDSTVDMWGINFYIGMMGSADADPVLHRLYQVATCSKDASGRPASIEQRMFVLSMVDGSVLANVPITGTSNGNSYTAAPRKQRSAILPWVLNGVRFKIVLSSTFSENGALATGFITAFDTYDNRFKAITSLGAGGWMSGQGPAMDENGLIYLGLGNGPYTPPTKFGEAVLQIRFTPSTPTTSASFAVLHSWALFSDDDRTCRKVYAANKVAGASAPSSVPGAAMPMVAGCDASWGDQDANLAGKYLADVHKYLTCGKDGICALVDTKNFPDTKPADFLNPSANCAKVGLYEPGWNLGISPCPVTAAALNTFGRDDLTRHIHSTPATYIDEAGVHYELFMAENSPLQAWRVNSDGTMTYIARGQEIASSRSRGMHGGMPGGFLSVTTNAGKDGLAWVSIPDLDANRQLSTGHLSAYDLRGLGKLQGTNGFIPRVWVSDTYSYSKFSQPMVRKGHVYLPNYAGSVMVW
jgi:hypothetical protein